MAGKIYLTENQLYRLSGLLEADGYFIKALPSNPNQPIIGIEMADLGVMQEISNLVHRKISIRNRKDPRFSKLKTVYMVRICGKDAMTLMKQLKPLMGLRRQEQIQQALDSYIGEFKNKLTDEQVKEVRCLYKQGNKIIDIAKQYNINSHYMEEIIKGRRRVSVV